MRLFTLIHGDSIHTATPAKVLKKETFSTALDGTELLKKVHEDAEKYCIYITKECDQIKAQAELDGFQAGLLKWNEQLALLEQTITGVNAEVTKIIIPTVMAAIKLIIGKELKQHPEIIIDIVTNALKSVSTHRKIDLFVNRADLAILEKNKPHLKQKLEQVHSFTIQEGEDIPPLSCRIQTEVGIVPVIFEAQLEALEATLKSRMKK